MWDVIKLIASFIALVSGAMIILFWVFIAVFGKACEQIPDDDDYTDGAV